MISNCFNPLPENWNLEHIYQRCSDVILLFLKSFLLSVYYYLNIFETESIHFLNYIL